MGNKFFGITLCSLAVVQLAIGALIEYPIIGSVTHGGKHLCNAIGVDSDVAIVPAACIRQSDPLQSYSVDFPSNADPDRQRKYPVKRIQPHPSYHFLSNNIGLVQVGCAGDVSTRATGGLARFRDASVGERLTLVAVELSGTVSPHRKLLTPVHVQDCGVCVAEYGAFDCRRQLCLQLAAGKYRSNLNNLDGLAGAAVLAPDGSIVGLLSYGFARRSLVAERMAFYEAFVREMVSSLQL